MTTGGHTSKGFQQLAPSAETEEAVCDWLRGWTEEALRRHAAYGKNPAMETAHAYLTDTLNLLPAVYQACRGASPEQLDVIVSAVLVGRLVGESQTWSYFWWQEMGDAVRRVLAPDTQRGRKTKRAASDGGKRRKERLQERSAERHRKSVTLFQELHRKHPRRSQWDLCQEIGRTLGLSPRTVMRYLKKAA